MTFTKPTGREHATGSESKLFDVSVRGWIALIVTTTLCAVVITQIEVRNATFHDIVLIVVGGYFQRGMQMTQNRAAPGTEPPKLKPKSDTEPPS